MFKKQEYDKLFKIPFLGDSGVGKSSLLQRYIENKYTESYIDKIGKEIWIAPSKNRVKLQFCDTANQQGRFSIISASYVYRGSHAYVLVYDINDRESFNRIQEYWMHHLNAHVGSQPVILVGTKSDIEGKNSIDQKEAIQLAKDLSNKYRKKITYFGNTSAKGDVNVTELMDYITCQLEPSLSKILKPISAEENRSETVTLTPLLLELPVPAHIKEGIPTELDHQVTRILGYIENRLHISLGLLSVNMANLKLKRDLLQGLATIFQQIPLPQRIVLDSPQPFDNARYFAMLVKKSYELQLKAIYEEILILINTLEKQYGAEHIAIQKWASFSTHVSLYGQLTEKLELQNIYPTEFIPTTIQLRNNEELVYSWDLGLEKLISDARNELELGTKKLDLFQQDKLATTEFRTIQNHFEKGECYFKNCEKPLERLQCLLHLGSLSKIMYMKTYGNYKLPTSSFYATDENTHQMASYRLRSINYALAIAQSLMNLNSETFLDAPRLLEEIDGFLQENIKFLNGLENTSANLLEYGIDYQSAQRTLHSGLEKLGKSEKVNCITM